MNAELKRIKTITLISGFIQDVLFKEEQLTDEAALESATLYHDVVIGCRAEVEKEEETRLATQVIRDKEAGELKAQGVVDASDAFAVDSMGGPAAIDNNTIYRG